MMVPQPLCAVQCRGCMLRSGECAGGKLRCASCWLQRLMMLQLTWATLHQMQRLYLAVLQLLSRQGPAPQHSIPLPRVCSFINQSCRRVSHIKVFAAPSALQSAQRVLP